MPKLRETESERIRRDWNALVSYKQKMSRIYTIEQLGKRVGCCRITAGRHAKDPMSMTVNELVIWCKALKISMDELNSIFKGEAK